MSDERKETIKVCVVTEKLKKKKCSTSCPLQELAKTAFDVCGLVSVLWCLWSMACGLLTCLFVCDLDVLSFFCRLLVIELLNNCGFLMVVASKN